MRFLEVFQIFISPIKAFKKIVKEPSYIGPILVLVLTIIAAAGIQYMTASKVNLENFALDNTLIPSAGPPYNITEGFTDFTGSTKISVLIYNWTSELDSVTIYGTNSQGENINETVSILESDTANNTANNTTEYFTSVTRVEFSKAGDNKTQYVALGTNRYESVLDKGLFSGLLVSSLIGRAFGFFLNWALYALLLYVIIRYLFREEVESLGGLFMIIGYVFIVTLIHPIISVLLIPMFPPVMLPLQAWNLPQEATEATKTAANNLISQIYQEAWYSTLNYQALVVILYVIDAWMVALFAVAIHFYCDVSWKKAAAISIIAYFARLALSLFVGI